ncbi:hypothetical protein BDV11DRAFT_124249 [Aspergillus similis]
MSVGSREMRINPSLCPGFVRVIGPDTSELSHSDLFLKQSKSETLVQPPPIMTAPALSPSLEVHIKSMVSTLLLPDSLVLDSQTSTNLFNVHPSLNARTDRLASLWTLECSSSHWPLHSVPIGYARSEQRHSDGLSTPASKAPGYFPWRTARSPIRRCNVHSAKTKPGN